MLVLPQSSFSAAHLEFSWLCWPNDLAREGEDMQVQEGGEKMGRNQGFRGERVRERG